MTLSDFFRAHPKAALSFSGGVDSAYLLAAAVRAGADVRPYFVKTPFQPAFELADAKKLTDQLGVTLIILDYNVLCREAVAKNPADRCYHCKKALFGLLRQRALADGYDLLLDGTNASDEASDRPGMRALSEQRVLSPLRLCGLTKDEIRRRSRDLGLFTWGKPAYACLATRIPTGMVIDLETLQRIEGAEDALMALGYSDFRVRVLDGCARVQLKKDQFPMTKEKYDGIVTAISPYFDTIFLDLKGR